MKVGSRRSGQESRDWIGTAVPPVPRALADRMRSVGWGPARPDAEALSEAASSELRGTLGEGRGRAIAFRLLAADGLLTYACEAALEEASAATILEELARRMACVQGPGGAASGATPRPRSGG